MTDNLIAKVEHEGSCESQHPECSHTVWEDNAKSIISFEYVSPMTLVLERDAEIARLREALVMIEAGPSFPIEAESMKKSTRLSIAEKTAEFSQQVAREALGEK